MTGWSLPFDAPYHYALCKHVVHNDIVYGLNASEETFSNAGLLGWRWYVFQVQLTLILFHLNFRLWSYTAKTFPRSAAANKSIRTDSVMTSCLRAAELAQSISRRYARWVGHTVSFGLLRSFLG